MISLYPPFNTETIDNNISKISERSLIICTKNETTRVHPDNYIGIQRGQLRAPEIVSDTIKQLITSVIERWKPEKNKTAFEVSGGVDSATVITACTPTFSRRITTTGIILPNEMGTVQMERRSHVIPGYARDLVYTLQNDAPEWISLQNWTPYDDYLYSIQEQQIKLILSKNIKFIVTGIGGDELYPIHAQNKTRFPEFLTKDAKEIFETFTSMPFSRSIIPLSSLEAASCRAPHFLRHGIWP